MSEEFVLSDDQFGLVMEAVAYLKEHEPALGDEGDYIARICQEFMVQNDQTPAPLALIVFPEDSIVDAAFEYFRQTGFPYRKLARHTCMQQINKLARTGESNLANTTVGYQVADTYHPHRFHASANKMKSPIEGFSDDKLLRRAIKLQYGVGNVPEGFFGPLSLVSGVQACSNFRPGFALKYYRMFCNQDSVILDSSTGYGGRLVGFMASGAAHYIGIDPNTVTCAANQRMADELGFSDRVELINLPAEDVDFETVRDRCDFAFTSPPYFSKELYSDQDTQSWKRYGHSGEAWRDGFLRRMLRMQFAALKTGSYTCINIADVNVGGQSYPLEEWTIEAAQLAGFVHIRTDKFDMSRRFGANMDEEVASEPVFVFRKP
jgi:hypothetical protein